MIPTKKKSREKFGKQKVEENDLNLKGKEKNGFARNTSVEFKNGSAAGRKKG